ncbi:MAG: tRNA (guanosine(46)-N7)-methyltransferase TrmB [Phycisphaerales bacterium]|nr:tRNA (guanosine(46)-N7)-methyltransferase TrmB [Phycisphaerales bacterium]
MSPPTVAVDPLLLAPGFTWDQLFEPARPIEVEIGCGKGGFLLRRAKNCPERSFLGIEWANEFYRYTVDRMQRWNMANVRVARTDASHFIRLACPRTSIAALHIYHPDPWPKKRHHKRRLFQPAFVDAAVACLVPRGRLSIQTDHAEYFEIISKLVDTQPGLQKVPFSAPEYGVDEEGVATNFEIKYRREGRPIYQLAAERIN